MPVTQSDFSRSAILDRFRHRIATGDRTKLTRQERDQLAVYFVDRLIELNQQGKDTQAAIRKLCEAEKSLLEQGYPQSSINSAYLPTYTRALKQAIANGAIQLSDRNSYPKPWTKRDGSETGMTQTHYALDYLTYDGATQAQLRSLTTAKNNDRQDDLKPVQLDAYLRQVMALLDSQEPELLTIAIAALTGRRFAEVAAVGQFEPTSHPYQLRFSGQQKKAESEPFEIVSLIPVKELLPVIDRLRSLPTIQAIAGLDDDHPKVQAFNARVNRRVKSLFEEPGLVPVLEGFKTVSVHRLRALYGAIAIHFFCANNQHIHRFLQNHLGHILTQEVGAANSRATDHYFHYFLIREDGTPLTARGIKLMASGPLLEDQPVPTTAELPAPDPSYRNTVIRIAPETRDRWNQLLADRFPDLPNQATRMTALLDWLEAHPPQPESEPQPEPQQPEPVPAESHSDLAALQATLTIMMERLERLEKEKQHHSPPITLQPITAEKPISHLPLLRSTKATDRAARIFQAVQEWNRHHPDQSFAITLGLLKDEFGINFKAAKTFLETHQNEIWELHQSSGVENPRSHNRQLGRDVQDLKQFVRSFN